MSLCCAQLFFYQIILSLSHFLDSPTPYGCSRLRRVSYSSCVSLVNIVQKFRSFCRRFHTHILSCAVMFAEWVSESRSPSRVYIIKYIVYILFVLFFTLISSIFFQYFGNFTVFLVIRKKFMPFWFLIKKNSCYLFSVRGFDENETKSNKSDVFSFVLFDIIFFFFLSLGVQ